ncbi:MAG: polysaccharide deacetylase family protein [Clostridia bacterium]|nr:polysaccharide deacetylase family protein [Clostridia bacterium]
MKILDRKRLNVITAVIISILVIGVVAVCFAPSKIVHISGSNTYEPYYNGKRDTNKVALTFNVYEGSQIVESILNVLKDNNAKATFFVGGCWADENIELIKKIISFGHEIGSHGYYHKDHKLLSESENLAEMQMLHTLIEREIGYKITLFAPPSGSFSVTTLKVAENLGYKTIMWSKDTIDWRDKSSKTVYNRATRKVCGGDIILMHPKEHTLNALNDILEYYQNNGLVCVTVSECLG